MDNAAPEVPALCQFHRDLGCPSNHPPCKPPVTADPAPSLADVPAIDVDPGLTVSFDPTSWSPSRLSRNEVIARIEAAAQRLSAKLGRLGAAKRAVMCADGKAGR